MDLAKPGKTRAVMWLAGLLMAAHAAVIWWARPGRVGTGGDDAFYIWLARSIREGSYREIHRFDRPFHSQYPPGYAVLLALGGDYASSTDAATVIGIFTAVITLAVLFDLCRRSMPSLYAVAALTLAAFNPRTIDRTAQVFAEAPYTAAAMVAVWLLVRFRDSNRAAITATLVAVIATAFRSVGLSLVGAIFVAHLLDRKFRLAAVHAMLSTIFIVPWLLWTFLAPHPVVDRSYVASLGSLIERGHYAPIRAALNAGRRFITSSFPLIMSTPTIEGTVVDNIYWVAVIMGLLVIGIALGWRSARLIPIYFLCYIVLIGIWPYHPVRFLLPLIPVMLWLLFIGGQWAIRRFRTKLVLALGIVSASLIVWFELRSDRDLVAQAEICRSGKLAACYDPPGVAFFQMADFARDNLPADAIVATVKEATFAYYAHRRVVSHLWLITYHRSDLLSFMSESGIRYVAMSNLVRSRIGSVLEPLCRRFRVTYQGLPNTAILALQPDEVPEPESACRVLQEIQLGPRDVDTLSKGSDRFPNLSWTIQ